MESRKFDFFGLLFEPLMTYFKSFIRIRSIVYCGKTSDRTKISQLKKFLDDVSIEIEQGEMLVLQLNYPLHSDDVEEVVERFTVGPVKCQLYLN